MLTEDGGDKLLPFGKRIGAFIHLVHLAKIAGCNLVSGRLHQADLLQGQLSQMARATSIVESAILINTDPGFILI